MDDILDFGNHSPLPFDDKSRNKNKVILLMHERAFRYKTASRNGKLNNKEVIFRDSELIKLKEIIKNLKLYNYNFSSLSDY